MVDPWNGSTVVISAGSQDTVKHLMQKVEHRANMSAEMQYLIFGSNRLVDNDQTVSGCGIERESMIRASGIHAGGSLSEADAKHIRARAKQECRARENMRRELRPAVD